MARGVVALACGLALGACGLDVVGVGTGASGLSPDGGPASSSSSSSSGGTPTDEGGTSVDGGRLPDGAAPVVDASCGDTLASATNCGVCGHSCGPTACKAGVCDPEPFGMTISDPHGIALTATEVYVACGSAMKRMPITGGAPVDLSGVSTGAFALATSDTRVYWVTQNKLAFETLGGGGLTTSDIATGRDIFFAGNRVFFSLASGQGVHSRDPNLNGDVTHTTTNPMTPDTWGIAADDTRVYWADRKLSLIARAPYGNNAVEFVALFQFGVGMVAVDSAGVYWTAGSEIHRAGKNDKPPTAPTTLAKDLEKPTSLVVSNGMLYWIDGGSGKLKRMPTTGGTPVVLSKAETLPGADYTRLVAVNATHVYWGSPSGNQVYRTPR